MPRGHSKAYSEWLRIAGAEDPQRTPPLADVIQPVVVVDDVSHLASPAPASQVGLYVASAAAGAGTYAIIEIRAIGRGLAIRRFLTLAASFAYLSDATWITAGGANVAWGFALPDATIQLWTGSGVVLPTDGYYFSPAVEHIVDIYVPRGAMFSWVSQAANTALTATIMAQEIPGL